MYVKLFSSILQSSIWAEDADTRVVWITMLALADQDGFVRGAESGVSRAANVSLAATRKALKALEAPDVESQSQEWGGRRIERIEGGWQILNYKKYRAMKDPDMRRAQTLARVRRHRAKARVLADETTGDASQRDVTPGNAAQRAVHQAEAEGEAENNAAASSGAREDVGEFPDIKAYLDPRAHAAYDALAATEGYPGAVGDTLSLVHTPITGGPRYTWPEISAALIEMQGNNELGGRFNAPLVRGVCRRLKNADAPVNGAGDGSSLSRATALWSLAMEKGLAQPSSRETLLEQCERLTRDPRLASIGCVNGRALFDLVCGVRLHELSARSAKDERFTLRDLAARLEQFTLRAAS
jgi:hypothetical protein